MSTPVTAAEARERLEHPSGTAADVQDPQILTAGEFAVEQGEEDATAPDEPEVGPFELDELAVGRLLHAQAGRARRTISSMKFRYSRRPPSRSSGASMRLSAGWTRPARSAMNDGATYLPP